MSHDNESNFYTDGLAYDLQLQARGQWEMGNEFFLWCAKKYGSPILELGCGSGRVTLILAQKGYQITGLDMSQPLLDIGKQKMKEKEGEGVNINFVQGDMSKFDLKKKFKLIIITGFAFMHLLSNEELYSHFHCIREHLQPGGVYIIETFNPGLKQLLNDPNEKRPYAEYQDPKTGKHVVMLQSNEYNVKSQVNTIKFELNMEGEISYQESQMRMIFPQELNMLLDFQGFEIIKKFGSWKRESFEENPFLQIIICKPKRISQKS